MYSQHFRLTQDPFSIAPDPRYLFMSDRHREALAHLLYGLGRPGQVAGGGFVLLTGDIGTGKTTICRCFLEQIPSDCHVAYIFNPKLSVTELLQSVCEEFHIEATDSPSGSPTVKNYIDAINAFLLQSHARGHSCLLIIDEAQNLESEVLEQLRLLTNLETNERKLLQIVLIGQPELRTMLERPELEQLAQRVIARFHLDALNAAECIQYIEHRLAVAGHTGVSPFDAASLRRIGVVSRGIPRRINLLCGRALLGAWATGRNQVDRAVVNKAAAEVFGSEAAGKKTGKQGWSVRALWGVVVLACATFAGYLTWSHRPELESSAAATFNNTDAAKPASASTATTEDIDSLLTQLPQDIDVAWHTLAPLWKVPDMDGDPCQTVPLRSLQCYRANELTVTQLRQLDRPGILTLQLGVEPPVYAVLTSLTDHTATLLIGPNQHSVRLVSLVRLWRGEFATYWSPPQGYVAGMPPGSQGPAVAFLARQLAKAEGSVGAAAELASAPSAPASRQLLDEALRLRVRAFQRAQGLKPDGQPGPLTYMQIESAIGSHEPNLQKRTP